LAQAERRAATAAVLNQNDLPDGGTVRQATKTNRKTIGTPLPLFVAVGEELHFTRAASGSA